MAGTLDSNSGKSVRERHRRKHSVTNHGLQGIKTAVSVCSFTFSYFPSFHNGDDEDPCPEVVPRKCESPEESHESSSSAESTS